MAAKNKDPFNFDDIYKQAGMGGFVKKSMAEQKASSTAAPRPASTTPSPAAKASMSNGSVPAVTRPVVASPSPRTAAGAGLGSHTSSASSLVGMEDPFASLGVSSKASQPMKAPVRSPSPAGMAAAKRPADSPQPSGTSSMRYGADAPSAGASAMSSSAPTSTTAPVAAFDLDDMFGLAAKRPAAAPPAANSATKGGSGSGNAADPFAAFEAVEGAAPAVAAPAASAAQAEEPLTFHDDFGFPAATQPPAAQPESPPPATPPTAAASPPRAAATSATTYFAMYEESGREQAGRADGDGAREPSFSRQRRQSDEERFAHGSSYEARHSTSSSYTRYGDSSSDVAVARESEQHASHSSNGSGGKTMFGGLLKGAAAWGKKGLKAAQAGLQQLESALENMDGKGPGGTGSPRASARHHYNDGQDAGADEDVPAEQVLQIAIRVSEMPSRQQEEKLARLPRSVRMKVQAILREQAVLEGEGSLSPPVSSPMAPRSNGRGDAQAVDIQTQEFDLDAAAAARDPTPPRRAPPTAAPSQQRQAAAPPARQQPSPAAQPPAEDDLLGVGGSSASVPRQSPAAPAPKPAPPAVHEEEDLLGLSGRSAAGATAAAVAAAAAPPQRPTPVQEVADVDDFFSGGSSSKPAATSSTAPKAAGAVHGSSSAGQLGHLTGKAAAGTASRGTSSAARPPKASSMIDLGGLDALHSNVDVSGHSQLYGATTGEEGEPELRRQLRAAREAEKHAKMKQALAEKLAKEEEEKRRREGQLEHKQLHKERIEAWKNKNKGNVRGLLGSLQTVLWEDSGWKPISMGDLLEPAQVRKGWMKANLLVHPDKVRQRHESDEHVAIADMIFDALKQAMENLR